MLRRIEHSKLRTAGRELKLPAKLPENLEDADNLLEKATSIRQQIGSSAEWMVKYAQRARRQLTQNSKTPTNKAS